MSQDYDKIFKENVEELILPMARKILGLELDSKNLIEIPDDLQSTIERRPDFLKKVKFSNNAQDYILHIEFQTVDESDMIFRMLEYKAILVRKYQLPIKQFVFFLGSVTPQMPLKWQDEDMQFQFHLRNIYDFDYTIFLESDQPEEVILAILSNFQYENPVMIIEKILTRLQKILNKKTIVLKYVRQLEILAKLRNLQELTIQKTNDMAFTYDIKTDIRYLQGKDEGKVEGKVEGKIESIRKLLANPSLNLSLQQLSDIFDLPLELIEQIQQEIKNQ